MSLTLRTAIRILPKAMTQGRTRKMGFSLTGIGQPLGFSVNLVPGGVLVETIGWRFRWYICAASISVLLPVGIWTVLREDLERVPSETRLRTEVDRLRAITASACLVSIACVLVYVSSSTSYIHKPSMITLLANGSCIRHVSREEKEQRFLHNDKRLEAG